MGVVWVEYSTLLKKISVGYTEQVLKGMLRECQAGLAVEERRTKRIIVPSGSGRRQSGIYMQRLKLCLNELLMFYILVIYGAFQASLTE